MIIATTRACTRKLLFLLVFQPRKQPSDNAETITMAMYFETANIVAGLTTMLVAAPRLPEWRHEVARPAAHNERRNKPKQVRRLDSSGFSPASSV
ncbi:hypothetical protein KQX54_001507 [Cotesia glomerata]|uniref:Uncharacterized protein n=1 Tax=Cotesia glomerata TaxID=32391 RepID=A0AAV7I0P1_COTGL|nr:hypothetical protein KQX54_001507 [Cotesia glomerata]